MFHRNVQYQPYQKPSPWRKVALGTWSKPGDPTIYGLADFDARPILKKLEELRNEGHSITVTALTAKAIAMAIRKCPSLNATVRFGRIYRRESIDIFLQVAPDDQGSDLSGVTIRNCDEKSLEAISEELKSKTKKVRSGDDDMGKSKQIMNLVPGWLITPMMGLIAHILFGLNRWSPLFGLPKDCFGSAMVTAIGTLGIEYGFAPLVPNSRCPLVLAVGKITDKPVVENGQVVACPMLPITSTIDHRLVDGVGLSKVLKTFREYLADPQ